MIIENIDEEPEEIRLAWDQFCRIKDEKKQVKAELLK